MNERQLESFITAADQKSFTKAAKINYISVQAFIQQIDILEESLGFELFIRTRRGVELTPGGEIFYGSAKKILKLYYDSIEKARKESNSQLLIAVPEEQYPDYLLSACHAYSRQYPDTTISFVSAPMTEHFHMIRNHMADCSFVGEPASSYLQDLRYDTLQDDFYTFAMNPNHPLAKKSIIKAEDLAGQTILCGLYPFMEHPFMEGLTHTGAELVDIKKEYDFSIKSKVLFSESLLVFPSRWKSFYSRSLQVVDSNISAGSVGIIYRKRAKKGMEDFITFIKEYEKGSSQQ